MTKKCWANQSCFTISSASKNIFVVGKIEPDGLSGSLSGYEERREELGLDHIHLWNKLSMTWGTGP